MDTLDTTDMWDGLAIPDMGDTPETVQPASADEAIVETSVSDAETTTPSDARKEPRPERRVERRGERRGSGHENPATPPPKLCLAFRGIGGGVGTTTIAIEMAHMLAGSRRGSVCLVDLDFELGTLHHYLDTKVHPRIEDLSGDPERLDAQYLRARLFKHEAGFSVFAPKSRLGGNEEVDPACVLTALDALGEMFDVLVLDVPRLNRPWTQAALMASDVTCLVGELTIPVLHLCRQRTEEVEALGAQRVEIVLSRYERRSLRASLRTGDAERALGKAPIGVIASDPGAAHDALNCAEPVGKVSRDSRMTKDIGALARELTPHYAERRRRPR